MNYFNFFSQYSGGRRAASNGKKSLITVSLIAVLFCVGIYGFYMFRCSSYQSQLDYLNEIKTNETFIKQYSVATKVADQIGGAEKELIFMQLLELYADTVSTLNTSLMDLIDECVIDGVHLSSVDLDGLNLDLKGYAPDLTTIIMVEQKFRNSGEFSSVLMRTAENDAESTGMVSFNCILQLDGGAIPNE
jgi:hypothetical protein